jgi:hypothetical protein
MTPLALSAGGWSIRSDAISTRWLMGLRGVERIIADFHGSGWTLSTPGCVSGDFPAGVLWLWLTWPGMAPASSSGRLAAPVTCSVTGWLASDRILSHQMRAGWGCRWSRVVMLRVGPGCGWSPVWVCCSRQSRCSTRCSRGGRSSSWRAIWRSPRWSRGWRWCGCSRLRWRRSRGRGRRSWRTSGSLTGGRCGIWRARRSGRSRSRCAGSAPT